MCASTFLLGTCVRTFKSVCVWSRPPIISCQLKGVPATLPSPPTFPLPRGGPADDTGESTAGAASRCALRHPSLKQPAARTSGPPPLLLPSCNPSSPSGVGEGFFFRWTGHSSLANCFEAKARRRRTAAAAEQGRSERSEAR